MVVTTSFVIVGFVVFVILAIIAIILAFVMFAVTKSGRSNSNAASGRESRAREREREKTRDARKKAYSQPEVPRNTSSQRPFQPQTQTQFSAQSQAQFDSQAQYNSQSQPQYNAQDAPSTSVSVTTVPQESGTASVPSGSSSSGSVDPGEIYSQLSSSDHAEMAALLQQGRPVEAIKVLQDKTGLGLKDAKDVIEGWRSGNIGAGVMNNAAGTAVNAAASMLPDNLPPEIASRVETLVAADNKIEAIRALREGTNFSLAEAASLIDQLRKKR